MSRIRSILTRLGARFTRCRDDEELAEEMAAHLALLEDDLRARGMSAAEAHRQARVRLQQGPTREAVHDARAFPLVDQVWRTTRQSLRSLRRAPLFTVTAVLTLALGIGATATVYSVADTVLRRPLPYPEPNRLVALRASGVTSFSGEEISRLRDRLRSVGTLAWSGSVRNRTISQGREVSNARVGRVSGSFFDVLGVTARRGRTLRESDDVRGAAPVIVLSDVLWRSMFHSRPDIVGTAIEVAGTPHEVVGVMPAAFRTFPGEVDAWVPLQMSPRDQGRNHDVIARLRSDTTLDQARAELAVVGPAVARELELSEHAMRSPTWVTYGVALGEEYRPVFLILLGAVGCVLLVACVNVAGLQLVRGTARRVEIATRAAMGGGPRRLMCEVLAESLLLTFAGGVLGVMGAWWVLPRITARLPALLLDGRVPSLEPAVLAVITVVTVTTGLVFGYLPARDARRVDVRAAIGTAGRETASLGTLRWRRVLAVGQIALAVTLLAGAALLGRTLLSLYRVDLGFDPSGLVIGQMSMTGVEQPGGTDPAVFFERTLAGIRALPGVTSAVVTSSIPVDRALNLALEAPAGSRITDARAVDWRYVSSGFFEMFGVRLRAGRLFDDTDTATSAPVVIVSRTFAAAYFGDEPAVGRAVRLAIPDAPVMTIVGVVNDLRGTSGTGWGGRHALKDTPAPGIFVPASQGASLATRFGADVNWVVRSRRGAADTAHSVAAVVRDAEPRLPFVSFRSMDDVISAQVAQERALFALLAAFASLALVLALVGTYGMTAYGVSIRTRDVSIRLALGASTWHVLRVFLHEGLVVLLAGTTLGLVGSVVVASAIRSFVWGVAPFDPLTIGGVATAFGLVVLLAMSGPVLRALRVRPAQVLRGS